VIPALYLHDIGWSAIGNVEEFIKTPAFKRERGRDSLLHMNFSADLARGILEEVGYDPVRLDKIINIIAVHDLFEEIIALNDISATLVFEADHMDRFGKGGLQRYREMTGDVPSSDEEMSFLKKGAQSWFQTSASRELVHQLILEMKEELSNIRR
jgi:uncharacterized protein